MKFKAVKDYMWPYRCGCDSRSHSTNTDSCETEDQKRIECTRFKNKIKQGEIIEANSRYQRSNKLMDAWQTKEGTRTGSIIYLIERGFVEPADDEAESFLWRYTVNKLIRPSPGSDSFNPGTYITTGWSPDLFDGY